MYLFKSEAAARKKGGVKRRVLLVQDFFLLGSVVPGGLALCLEVLGRGGGGTWS